MSIEEQIAEYLTNLKIKKSFSGYDKEAVLDSYKRIVSMYQEFLDEEKEKSAETIKALEKRIEAQDARIEELIRSEQLLVAESKRLAEANENMDQNLSTAESEKADYLRKADALATTLTEMKYRQQVMEEKLAAEREEVLDAASAEALALMEKMQIEMKHRRNQELEQIQILQTQRKEITTILSQVSDSLRKSIEQLSNEVSYGE